MQKKEKVGVTILLLNKVKFRPKKKLSETKKALYNVNCKIHNEYVRYINSK